MKVLAVIALLAVAAYASEQAEEHVVLSANSAHFVGELQEGEKIHQFGSLDELAAQNTALFSLPSFIPHLIPSCKLGKTIGNPICMAKCISRGHAGGYCDGSTCKCVD